MYIDFGDMTPQQVYITMTQTVIPRPIAWVLSENADGSLNLAPTPISTRSQAIPRW